MRQSFLITIIVFLAGLGIGYFARSAGLGAPGKTDSHAADMAAIERLHRADVAATLAQDSSAMTNLWSDDGVNLGFPGGPVGLKAIGEAYAKMKVDYPDFKVLKYESNIKDVRILDGWAIEVGDVAATYQMSPQAAPVNVNDTGMRLLKRQSDGSWKFALVGLK
jgi:uncharacterized protein (TIGR02246 family)